MENNYKNVKAGVLTEDEAQANVKLFVQSLSKDDNSIDCWIEDNSGNIIAKTQSYKEKDNSDTNNTYCEEFKEYNWKIYSSYNPEIVKKEVEINNKDIQVKKYLHYGFLV